MNIKISIIIPVYNSEKFLNRCLDSIVNQTIKDIEIICINDGSTDNSLSILNDYAKNDKRISIINISNHGAGYARNKGLEKAKGDYIGFCDSDDYVDLNYYETLYNYSLQQKYDIIRGIRTIGLENVHCNNEYGCIVPAIIKRTFLAKTKIKFPMKKTGEDSTFKRWLYKQNPNVFEVPDTNSYYHYIKREGSLSNYILSKPSENNSETNTITKPIQKPRKLLRKIIIQPNGTRKIILV